MDNEQANYTSTNDTTDANTNEKTSATNSANAYKGTGIKATDEEKPLYTSGTSEMPAQLIGSFPQVTIPNRGGIVHPYFHYSPQKNS